MSKHSKVKLTKIFDIFSGVNVKTQDLGLKPHATNAEMSQPTISLNNVMTLKIAFIYFLPALSLPHPFLGTYQGHAALAAPKQLQVTSCLWRKSPYQEG